MATWEEIEEAIRCWVETSSGLPEEQIVFAKENIDRPKGLFFRIDTQLFSDTVGTGVVQGLNDSEQYEIQTLERFMVTVSAFGKGSFEALRSVIRKLKLPSIRQLFKSVNLGLIDIEPVLDSSYTENRQTRHQAFCELMFNAKFIEIDTGVGVFDTIESSATNLNIPTIKVSSND